MCNITICEFIPEWEMQQNFISKSVTGIATIQHTYKEGYQYPISIQFGLKK